MRGQGLTNHFFVSGLNMKSVLDVKPCNSMKMSFRSKWVSNLCISFSLYLCFINVFLDVFVLFYKVFCAIFCFCSLIVFCSGKVSYVTKEEVWSMDQAYLFYGICALKQDNKTLSFLFCCMYVYVNQLDDFVQHMLSYYYATVIIQTTLHGLFAIMINFSLIF